MARRFRAIALASAWLAVATAWSACLPPSIAARMILEPRRRPVEETADPPHREVAFTGDGVELRGWLFEARGEPRGTVIFLHGRNQNRDAGLVVARRLVPLGYDVLAYDSRAHGESGGKYSTFGYYEKQDVSRAIDFLGVRGVVLVGVSLGAAVAIQAAAEDARVSAVVAVSSFSSLEEIVREQVPRFIGDAQVRDALGAVERLAAMKVKDADSVEAARHVTAPVLLLHGDLDGFTPIAHTEQIYAALRGERAVVRVPGAHHGDVLAFDAAWKAILAWLPSTPEGRPGWSGEAWRGDPGPPVAPLARGHLDRLGERASQLPAYVLEPEGVAPGRALDTIRRSLVEGIGIQLSE